MTKGDTIKTLYGAAKVLKVNKASVRVLLLCNGHEKTIGASILAILNGSN